MGAASGLDCTVGDSLNAKSKKVDCGQGPLGNCVLKNECCGDRFSFKYDSSAPTSVTVTREDGNSWGQKLVITCEVSNEDTSGNLNKWIPTTELNCGQTCQKLGGTCSEEALKANLWKKTQSGTPGATSCYQNKWYLCYCIEVKEEDPCNCTGDNSKIPEKQKRYYGTSYGLTCDAHDMSHRYCNERSIGKENRSCWCPKNWCYVSSECKTAHPSVLFEGAGLYYSYETCFSQGDKCFSNIEGDEAETEFTRAKDEEDAVYSTDLEEKLASAVSRLEAAEAMIVKIRNALDSCEYMKRECPINY